MVGYKNLTQKAQRKLAHQEPVGESGGAAFRGPPDALAKMRYLKLISTCRYCAFIASRYSAISSAFRSTGGF